MSSHRTASNLIVLSAASFAQLVIQVVIQLIIADAYGTAAETSAYVAALAIPTFLSAFVTGSLSYVLVPELARRFDAKRLDGSTDETAGWQLAWFLGPLLGGICAALSLLIYLGADVACGMLYELDTARKASLLRVLSVQVVFNGLISWAQAVHHSRHSFLIPALGGVLGTGLTLIVAHQYGSISIHWIAVAVNAGSLVSVVIHVAPLARNLVGPKAEMAELLTMLAMFWPLLLGTALMRIDPLVDRILVDPLGEEALALVHYAQRFLIALLAVGTSGLSLIAFPQLAERFARDGTASFAAHFSLAFRRLILLVVPISIGVSFFSIKIISDLFERGKFSHQDSIDVGWLIIGSMGMFAGASIGDLLARAYYVLGDTRTPTMVGIVCLALGLLVKLCLIRSYGVMAVAYGSSFYFLLSASIMSLLLISKIGVTMFSGSLRVSLVATTSGLIACGFCYLIYSGGYGRTWVAAPVGAVIYAVCLLLMGNSDALQMRDILKKRLSMGTR